MKSFLIFLVGAVVGGIACIILASGIFTGIGAGVGIATGLQAGACLTVEAARDQGLVTAEQVDDVLNAAVKLIASEYSSAESTSMGGDLECEKVVAQLKEAGKQSK
ncbi:MAG: hypothetical protein WBN95_12925 [Gammaproteobacteria bacterium]